MTDWQDDFETLVARVVEAGIESEENYQQVAGRVREALEAAGWSFKRYGDDDPDYVHLATIKIN